MLPSPPKPLGSYAPCIVHSGLGLLSGQFPIRDSELIYKGLVGYDLTLDEARNAAALAATNALAQIENHLNGLDNLAAISRSTRSVNTTGITTTTNSAFMKQVARNLTDA